MKPIKFKEHNAIIAKDQPQYLQLPAHIAEDGTVTSCWLISWKEMFKLILGRRLYFQQLTFGQPLQPQRPSVENPVKP